jgi:hypothetical protein
MKKLLISALACIALVISSCNQNSPAPAPAPASPTPTPTPTSSMTATEAALVGDWIFDYQEIYSAGNLILTISPTTHTILTGNHMVLKSTLYLNSSPTTETYYQGDFYVGTSAGSSLWYVTTSLIAPNTEMLNEVEMGLDQSGAVYIKTLNANTLICQDWNIGSIANGYKTYFHK